MNSSDFVIAIRINSVWRIARASRASRACFAGVGRTPERAFSQLFAAARRAAQ